jgi:hypothetical protein
MVSHPLVVREDLPASQFRRECAPKAYADKV